MGFVQFQLYNVTGAVIWVVSLVSAGYFLGHIPVIRDNLNTIVVIGITAAMLPLMLGGLWRLLRRKSVQ
jgi:membrane-associated protein